MKHKFPSSGSDKKQVNKPVSNNKNQGTQFINAPDIDNIITIYNVLLDLSVLRN